MPEENLQKNVDGMMSTTDAAPKKDDSHYGELKPLRTYQGDVSEIIGKTKASVVSIATAEQKRKTLIEPENKPETGNHDKFFVVAGTVLFLLGIFTVGVFYYLGSENKITPVNQNNSILNYDQEVDIAIAGGTHPMLVSKISDTEESFNSPANSVLYINTGEKNAPEDVQTVLVTLAPQIPPELLRNLSPNYMLGVYSFDKNQPFIILTVDDYGAGFSGMLKWENTMVADLGQIFDIATTTSLGGGYVFADESLSNKDLRIVRNNGRQTVLLYSFLDKNTVLITTNENTFNALLNKYLTSQYRN